MIQSAIVITIEAEAIRYSEHLIIICSKFWDYWKKRFFSAKHIVLYHVCFQNISQHKSVDVRQMAIVFIFYNVYHIAI